MLSVSQFPICTMGVWIGGDSDKYCSSHSMAVLQFGSLGLERPRWAKGPKALSLLGTAMHSSREFGDV